jgi:hypothetical protein
MPFARVNLELQLANGENALGVRGNELSKGVKLAALNINFEYVNKRVA